MKYDVFISFKCSDDLGNKTEDFEIANLLYNKLTSIGYNVFFSANTLEQKGSSRYKADIDDALDSASVMIVVLTKHEYATSHWVQYEWDSFYNDYLSGVKPNSSLFTLTKNVDVKQLPRTLRNIQNFDYKEGLDSTCKYVINAIPREIKVETKAISEESEKKIRIITGKEVTIKDIKEAIKLDAITYDDIYHVDSIQCEEWFKVNPDIYVMAKDLKNNKIIAYVNIMPVTEECYELIKEGHFIDSGITADMVLSYDMPCPYSIYFSSIVIHPDYQNTEVFMELFNAIIDKFIWLGNHEVYIKRMIADAVTTNGEKFCKLFGMKKIIGSTHNSTLYEATLIPPKFRIISRKTKILYDYYNKKYIDEPYLFD